VSHRRSRTGGGDSPVRAREGIAENRAKTMAALAAQQAAAKK
jgi:hypothetical protein